MAVVIVAKTCPGCGNKELHAIPQEGYLNWERGMLIQKALPELNECIREFLITGFCTECRTANDAMLEQGENEVEEEGTEG